MPDMPPRHQVNPYIAGSAVKGAEMFFGRDDVFAFIRRNLIGKHSNHPLVLYGQRRTGKTSVLHQLRRHLDPGYWCVLIDLHGLNLDGLGNLMQGIATVISRELRRDHQVTVEVPERSAFLADPAAAFETVFLDRVWAAIGDNQLVLMLDEVVRLDEEMRAGRLDRGVFEYLRHLMQHHERLNFVFSLGSGIEEMSRDYALLFSVSLYHRISFLEPGAARDLIIRPARGHYKLTGEAVDRILRVTSGHPYYTQLVCHCVFDAWARNPTAIIGADDVDGILTEAIELGSANLTYVWLDSSPAEQVVMTAIAASAPGATTAVTEGQLREAWHNAGVDVPAHAITQALRGLTAREVITGTGTYSFTVDLQRLWLGKHRRLEWVKEDLADAIAAWAPPARPVDDRPEHPSSETADQEDAQGPAPFPASSLEPASDRFRELAHRGGAARGDTAYQSSLIRDPTSRVRIQPKVIRIGRRTDNDIVVSDLGVSKQHAELRLSPAGRYQIIDLGSRGGTFVNGTRVNQAELTDDDIFAIGHATFRLVDGEPIEYVDDGRATFEAHDLQVVVTDNGNQKALLDGITFPLAERSMMAVIGPAGAGKSTLLNALTGKRPATCGTVYYDYRDLYDNYDELKHRIGLVPQESVTHNQLTAKTALGYAAKLRFPPDTGDEERSQRVDEVLDELSLAQHASTRIERLSADQQKSVNIGLELLTQPTLLFLDEPTAALDQHLTRNLFEQLRKMADPNAEKGQSVIVITRDIESELIDQCDRVLVLAPGGTMAFYGPPQQGLQYFQAKDWAVVFRDFSDSPARDWAAEFRASPEFTKYVATPISSQAQRLRIQPGRQREENAPERPRERGALSQVLTMSRRYRRVMRADRAFVLTIALTPILLGSVVRAIPAQFGLVNSTPQPGLNVSAILIPLVLVMAVCVSGTVLSIREFVKERDIYERERLAGLSATAYLFSKVIVLGAISVLQTLLVVLVGLAGRKLPRSGLVIPGTPLIEIFVALAVLGVISMLLGLAISALVPQGDQAMPILAVITVLQIALSGGLFPLVGGVRYVAYIAPASWGLGAVASTINVNAIQASEYQGPYGQEPDALWDHDPAHWLISVSVMIFIGIILLVIARVRLAAIGPLRRNTP